MMGVRQRNAWAAVAVVTVLLALSAGAPGAAGEFDPRATNKVITVPAGAFSVVDDDYDYQNDGYAIFMVSGFGAFAAPLFFESRQVTVNSITLYVTDDNATKDICVHLYRTRPWSGNEEVMGQVCSTGNEPDVRAFTQTALAPRQITGAYGPYLWVDVYSPDDLMFYAVRLNYTA